MIETPNRGFEEPDVPASAIFDKCVRCGLCLPSCPTYLETMTETSSPRGRISLIKSVGEGGLDVLSPGFTHQVSECLDCRACEAVCPSGVHYGRLIEDARAQVQRAEAPTQSASTTFLRSFVLRGMFRHLGRMRVAATILRFAQRSGLEALANSIGLTKLFGLADAAELAPRISDRFFIPDDQRYETPNAKAVAFLHTGCVMHVAFAHVHEATARVLQRAGCTVVVPKGQGCCGAIAIHAGEPDFGRELAKRNIVAFERSGADVYAINAAGCGSALKEYGELLAAEPDWADRAKAFSSRVRDITELLDALEIDPPQHRIDATVTYQEPCHLAHAQRVTGAPRRLLAKIPGLRLIEMDESSVCCGSAGIYNLTQPEMAKRLQARKVACVRATGARIVATANPGCALQLEAGLRDGEPVAVKHVVELLDAAYSGATILSRPASAASSDG
ncbi:MAG TPA: (Fe-S)-binding protein [Candidatus Baltobacteraceae bacterium]|jgi:glycolate oxidase iron-sulfur subunit